MWCYGKDWQMRNTKLCSTHEERESTTQPLISSKDDSKLSGGLKRRKMRQKGFWIKIFLRQEPKKLRKKNKNHPAALINIIENKAVVLLWSVRCWSASLPQPVSHGSIMTPSLTRSCTQRRLTHRTSDTTFYYWKKEGRLSVKKTNIKFNHRNKIT